MRFISALTLTSCVFYASASVLAHRRGEHHSRSLDPTKRSDRFPYGSTIAGAAVSTYEKGTTFYHVSGTITAPVLDDLSGGVAISLGIDMLRTSAGNYATCNGTLSAGMDVTPIQNRADGSSSPTHQYRVWCYGSSNRLYYNFPGFTVSPGDDIRLSVNASSTTSGAALIENLSTRAEAVVCQTPFAGYLCGLDASWLVGAAGDYPLAHFRKLFFSDATAIGAKNQLYTPDDGTVYDINQSGTDALTSTVTEGRNITVNRM